jgi:hypothetical protein
MRSTDPTRSCSCRWNATARQNKTLWLSRPGGMVDAQASGACVRKGVRVQVPRSVRQREVSGTRLRKSRQQGDVGVLPPAERVWCLASEGSGSNPSRCTTRKWWNGRHAALRSLWPVRVVEVRVLSRAQEVAQPHTSVYCHSHDLDSVQAHRDGKCRQRYIGLSSRQLDFGRRQPSRKLGGFFQLHRDFVRVVVQPRAGSAWKALGTARFGGQDLRYPREAGCRNRGDGMALHAPREDGEPVEDRSGFETRMDRKVWGAGPPPSAL